MFQIIPRISNYLQRTFLLLIRLINIVQIGRKKWIRWTIWLYLRPIESSKYMTAVHNWETNVYQLKHLRF